MYTEKNGILQMVKSSMTTSSTVSTDWQKTHLSLRKHTGKSKKRKRHHTASDKNGGISECDIPRFSFISTADSRVQRISASLPGHTCLRAAASLYTDRAR